MCYLRWLFRVFVTIFTIIFFFTGFCQHKTKNSIEFNTETGVTKRKSLYPDTPWKKQIQEINLIKEQK